MLIRNGQVEMLRSIDCWKLYKREFYVVTMAYVPFPMIPNLAIWHLSFSAFSV